MEINLSNEYRNNEATKWGIITGIVSILILIITYFIGFENSINITFSILVLFIHITILCIGVIRLRNTNNSYLNFKDAFLFLLITAIISGLLYTIGQYVLYNLIDTDLTNEMRNATANKLETQFSKTGMSSEEREETIEKITSNINFDILSLTKSYLYSIVGTAIISLIISAIVKRTPKEEII